MPKLLPSYPVFIPSKGRAAKVLTARMFDKIGVPFQLVVEPNEAPAYENKWGKERVLLLPENNRGLVYSRNWIKAHSTQLGHARHWQFDDDIEYISRLHHSRRLRCDANVAIVVAEDFSDRYENVALTSFNSEFFVPTSGIMALRWKPFILNARCYTVFLVNNSLPNTWRNRYNEDTDMSLQVLADGWCTLLLNAFLINTPTTMTAPGGQMVSAAGSYQGDGRLHMARELERCWPGVVTTHRKFGRPQHKIKNNWMKFDTQLKRKVGYVPPDRPDGYGLKLHAHSPPKSEFLQQILEKESGR
ncbi:MAG: hypothetical protein WC683_18705 [bacterium]